MDCSDMLSPDHYGEPIALRGNCLYFTSWRHVRQGTFHYERHGHTPAGDIDPVAEAHYSGDGDRAASFRPFDMPAGIRLTAQQPEKCPWPPGELGHCITIVFDEGRYKAWYALPPCARPEPFSTKDRLLTGHSLVVAYAESDDGLHWEKPCLELFEYDGDHQNNIVLRNDLDGSTRGWHGGSVFIDPSSPDERYKMVYLGGITEAEWEAFAQKYPSEISPAARRRPMGGYRLVNALFGAVSPDGKQWTNLPEPLLVDHCDTQNTGYYDEERGLYVVHVRTWQVPPKAPDQRQDGPSDSWIGVGRRTIGRAVSRDFRHFSRPEIVIATGADMAPSHLWYTNCKTTLPGSPDDHVMFPWRWELECDGGDCFLFSSADGWVWSQVPGGPVVRCGPPGAPDGGHIVCSPNLVELPGERWGLPYHGLPIPHKYPGRDVTKRTGLFPGVPDCSGYAVWPKGRLVALDCPDAGSFATIGLVPSGDRLRINAAIRPTGHIKISVAKLRGEAIAGRDFDACDHLVGNGLAMPVSWGGEDDLQHGGDPIVLRFQMQQAKLFGVEFY